MLTGSNLNTSLSSAFLYILQTHHCSSVKIHLMLHFHLPTRIRIPIAGVVFGRHHSQCSYRVRGVEGSCAKHLTIEFYMVVMLLTFILITISIPSPPHSFIPDLKPSFSANPSHCSLSFSSSGLTPWIPWTFYGYFWAYTFFTFYFSVLPLYSCWFRAVD